MWELVKAGGWLMLPIVICSILTIAIIIERWRALNLRIIAPKGLTEQMLAHLRQDNLSRGQLMTIKGGSMLGDVLATGLLNAEHGTQVMAMHMANRAGVQIHKLEKNINLLGTIGAIAPLLGLLGTVLGIISSFLAISDGALQDPTLLASGVSQALITTAAGMFVAIPAMMAYRHYQRKIVDINAHFEQEAGELMQGFLAIDSAPPKDTPKQTQEG